MALRLSLVVALSAVFVLPAGHGVQAQIVDALRDVLGPPVDPNGRPIGGERVARTPASQPAAPNEQPEESGPPDPGSVPVPTDRPDAPPPEQAATDTEAPVADEENGEGAASAPEAPPVPSPAPEEPAASGLNGEAPSDEPSAEADTDEPQSARPDDEAEPAPDEPAEDGQEEPKSGLPGREESAPAQIEPPPPPAYVSPEKARTTPEPGASLPPPSDVTPAAAVEAAAAVEDAVACEAELTRRGVTFEIGESLADDTCGVLRPVSITRLSSGVAVEPATQFLCRTALALDIWMSDGVVPAAADIFDETRVETLRHASTYVCRERASEARISEHSRGSAIDIAGFDLSDGRSVDVKTQAPQSADDRFLATTRRAACGPFTTVLGPGTDADHETHFHFDIAARDNGSSYCR